LKILRAFRVELIPPARPGRRRKKAITEAHRDWKAGIKKIDLYRKYIPGWEKAGEWRRKGTARKLMDAIRSRERRERRS
jgi:hypothetical protein